MTSKRSSFGERRQKRVMIGADWDSIGSDKGATLPWEGAGACAPRFFIWQLIGVICLPLVDLLWIASMASLATGQPISDYLTIEPKEGVQMIAGVIGALIWISYILKSRRVANTFTH